MLLDEVLQSWTECLGLHSIGTWPLQWGDGWVLLGLLIFVFFAVIAGRKLIMALFTLRALAWTPVLSRQLSKWVKSHSYSDKEFLRADGVGEHWIELRKQALDRLAGFFQTQCVKSIAWGNEIRESFSD